MLNHPTHDQLQQLRLFGMARALAEQQAIPDITHLAFEERLGFDLLEILDDRHGHRSTIVTSQLPVSNWHESIGDPTLADAILDRLVHSAHPLILTGESMRKHKNSLTQKQGLE